VRRVPLRVAPALLALALSAMTIACGGDDDDDSNRGAGETTTATAATGSAGADGAWKGEFDTGTAVEAELFVPADDPGVAAFEELRQAVGAPTVLYGRITATNNGDAPDTGRFLTLTDAEGDQLADDAIILDFACSKAYRWSQTAGISADAIRLYESVYTDVCNGASIAGAPIAAGETLVYYVVYEGESQPEFDRVWAGLGQELKR